MSNDDPVEREFPARPAAPRRLSGMGGAIGARGSMLVSALGAVAVLALFFAVSPESRFWATAASSEAVGATRDGECLNVVVTGRPTWQHLFSGMLLSDDAREYALRVFSSDQVARGGLSAKSADRVPTDAVVRACATLPRQRVSLSTPQK